MNIVLLSGGSGKRLWPLSNDIRAKQFIKIFKKEDGEYESMVQRMYRGLKNVDSSVKITIATSNTQIASIHNQLGDQVEISNEPFRRDTFPAIALAANYLYDVEKVGLDEGVVICPVDPYVEDDYFEALIKLGELAEKGDANLSLLGMEPTSPSEKFGYIIPTSKDQVSGVSSFKEKPTADVAQKYINQGALWNGGVFAFKLGYLIDKAHEYIDYIDYDDMFSRYETLEKISFDYAVVEKEKSIQVMRFSGEWRDLGTWNTLVTAMPEKTIGNVVMDDTCEDTHVLSELDIPIIAMGLKNVVVAASVEGILVADKEQSSYMKPLVDGLAGDVKYAEKSWGEYKVIDSSEDSMTIKVTLRAGNKMNYHSHEHRDEIWNVVSGRGTVIVDGMRQTVSSGQVITIQAGCRHTVIADTDIQLLEVQIGKHISVNDKIIYEME